MLKINMRPNYILIHGFEGSPDRNFFPWLKKQLKSNGCKVSVPKLPDPDNPEVMEQVRYVIETEEYNEDTIIVGFDLGAAIALKVLEQIDETILRLVLVSGFHKPIYPESLKPYNKTLDWRFDYEKIKNHVIEIIVLQDNNDSVVPVSEAEILRKVLNAKVIYFNANKEHATALEEPEILKACI